MCSIARDKHEYLVRPPVESQMGELLRDAGALRTLRETVDLWFVSGSADLRERIDASRGFQVEYKAKAFIYIFRVLKAKLSLNTQQRRKGESAFVNHFLTCHPLMACLWVGEDGHWKHCLHLLLNQLGLHSSR
jgi:hypothetical protein